MHRLYRWIDVCIVAYLVVPVLIFFARSFVLPAALLLVALTCLAVLPLLRSVIKIPPQGSIPVAAFAAAAIVAIVWVALGGSGHMVFAELDWVKHDTVYADLTRFSWPVTYFDQEGDPVILRYYLGFYVVPASIASLVGHHNLVMQAWVTLGALLVLLRVIATVARPGRRYIVLIVACVFGGLDILGWVAINGFGGINLDTQIDGWTTVVAESGWAMVQFPNPTTLLFWVPQHALAGWMATLLFYERRNEKALLHGFPILIAVSAFWSVFVAFGLLPFAVYLWWKYLPRPLLRNLTPSVVAAVIVGLVLALYLLSGGSDNQHGFLWQISNLPSASWRLLLLWTFEIAIVVGAMRLAGVRFAKIEWLAVVVLVALSTYVYGAWGDLVMRASIPSLFIIFLAFRRWMSESDTVWNGWRTVPLVLTILIGAYTASPQVVMALANEPEKRSQHEREDVLELLGIQPVEIPASQYITKTPPGLDLVMREPAPLYEERLLIDSVRPREWRVNAVNGYTDASVSQVGGSIAIRTDQAGNADIDNTAVYPRGLFRASIEVCADKWNAESRIGFGIWEVKSDRFRLDASGCVDKEFFVTTYDDESFFLSPRMEEPAQLTVSHFEVRRYEPLPVRQK